MKNKINIMKNINEIQGVANKEFSFEEILQNSNLNKEEKKSLVEEKIIKPKIEETTSNLNNENNLTRKEEIKKRVIEDQLMIDIFRERDTLFMIIDN